MIGADILTLPAQSQPLLGKKVSDMISKDTMVMENGDIIGTLHYVKEFPQFGDLSEQNGHFFPVVFGSSYKNKPVTIKGRIGSDRTVTLDDDCTLIIRKENLSGDTAEIESEKKPIVTLNFKTATLTPSD